MNIPVRIHFLNVGRGDCTIIEHPTSGNVTMVDINNSLLLPDNKQNISLLDLLSENNSSGLLGLLSKQKDVNSKDYDVQLDDPAVYILEHIGNKIFRFILTHPDCDHLTGLARLQQEIENKKLKLFNFWSLPNKKVITKFKSNEEQASWETYKEWTNKSFHRSYKKGDKNKYFNIDEYGSNDGDGIHILSPDEKLLDDADYKYVYRNDNDIYNNTSYILLITYGKSKIILGGDAFGSEGSTSPSNFPQEGLPNAWQHLLNTSSQLINNIDILKASHHGLESGFHPEAVKIMNPKLTIVSEGVKQDQDAQRRYPNISMSTRFWGTITIDVFSDGQFSVFTRKSRPSQGSISFTNELGFYYNNKSSYLFNDSMIYKHLNFSYKNGLNYSKYDMVGN